MAGLDPDKEEAQRRPGTRATIERADYPGWPARFVMAVPGWRPASSNQLRCHPMRQARLKRKDADVVARAKLILGVPAAISRRRLALEVSWPFSRPPDSDAYLKSTFDALVRCGLLVDDSDRWLEFEWPTRCVKGLPLTTIVLHDIEPKIILCK